MRKLLRRYSNERLMLYSFTIIVAYDPSMVDLDFTWVMQVRDYQLAGLTATILLPVLARNIE